jgi:hypothetical protein
MKKILLGIAGIAVLLGATVAYGAVTSKIKTQDTGYVQNYTFFTATTTTATSTVKAFDANDTGMFVIAGAKRVELFFSRAWTSGTNVGTTTFNVQVTPDGANWYNYARLVDATTTTPNIYSVAQVLGTTTAMYGLDLRTDAFLGVRCIAVFGGSDGNSTCKAYAEF